MSGQILCGAITMTTTCQANTSACPMTPLGPLQLCASADECFTKGDICAAPMGINLPIKICQPGAGTDGGSSGGGDGGGTDGGSSSSGDAGDGGGPAPSDAGDAGG
jgi:hypothetical protein